MFMIAATATVGGGSGHRFPLPVRHKEQTPDVPPTSGVALFLERFSAKTLKRILFSAPEHL
jgi:hypothetical protein